jgi:hypothetical protein
MTEAEAIWRSKTDAEVLAAASCLGDYTSEGQHLILAEAGRRGLNVAPLMRAAADLQRQTPSAPGRCAYCDTRILFGGKREGGLRFCNEECRRAGVRLSVSHQIPDQLIKERVATVFNGTCPRCGGPGPVDVHTSHRVISALVVTSWRNRPALTCRSCGNKARLRDAALSLGLGWWGLPWGLIMTPVQVVRNVAGLLGATDRSQPSSRLERLVRLRCADELVTEPPGPA